MHSLYQVWQLSSKGVSRYWEEQHFSKTSSLTLTFVNAIWKQRGHLLLGDTRWTKKNVKRRGQNYIERTSFLQKPEVWPWHWLYDLNIIKEHLVSRGIHHTKFGNFQRKGSKDIERTSHGLQTDRRMQNNLPPFFKRRYKNSVRDMFCSNVWRHSQFKKKPQNTSSC